MARVISRIKNHKFKTARLLLLGTRKSLQKSATGGAILLSLIEEFRRRSAKVSVTHLEAGWVLENNMDMRKPIEMFGGKVDKIHRIYEKRLETSEAPRASKSVEATLSRQDATT